jgi:hypothetical protein
MTIRFMPSLLTLANQNSWEGDDPGPPARNRSPSACDPRTAQVRYVAARDIRPASPLNAPTFWAHFEPLCERVGIRLRTKAGKVYCVGVKLAA